MNYTRPHNQATIHTKQGNDTQTHTHAQGPWSLHSFTHAAFSPPTLHKKNIYTRVNVLGILPAATPIVWVQISCCLDFGAEQGTRAPLTRCIDLPYTLIRLSIRGCSLYKSITHTEGCEKGVFDVTMMVCPFRMLCWVALYFFFFSCALQGMMMISGYPF